MESMVNFWKNKKVFITGHTGFKGSWLALWLQHLQADVVGFALSPPTPVNLFTVAKVADGMIDIRGDVRHYPELHKALTHHQPEFIFHLAAQPLVKYSYDYPVETYATNVMGTVHLLEAARYCPNLRAMINVTTDKCYENKEKIKGYQESERLGGYDPYSNSKACSELVTSAYRNSYFNLNLDSQLKVGLASARAGNVIGGGDWAKNRLIPDLILACVNNEELQIRYPGAIRPWQHVLESLSGYLQLAKQLYLDAPSFSEAWNFSPQDRDARPVSWIVEETLKLFGSDLQCKRADALLQHETICLTLDSTKARTRLGWLPKWDIQQALQSTVFWYQQYYRGEDAKKITLEQIINYEVCEVEAT